MTLAASRSATISACAVGSESVIVRFPAHAMILFSTMMTAPTGTSPRAAAAFASSSAACMNDTSDWAFSLMARQNSTPSRGTPDLYQRPVDARQTLGQTIGDVKCDGLS